MAHYKRNRPRATSGRGYSANGLARRLGLDDHDIRWWDHGPRWHHLIVNQRPLRRRTKAVERAAVKADDPEALMWPLARKPHDDYW